MGWDDEEDKEILGGTEEGVPTGASYTSKNKEETAVKVIEGDDSEIYKLMEREDERQILKLELFEETVKALVYDAKGKKTLTYRGVLECARAYKNLHFGIERIEEDKENITAYAYCHNIADNIRVVLPNRQSKFIGFNKV